MNGVAYDRIAVPREQGENRSSEEHNTPSWIGFWSVSPGGRGTSTTSSNSSSSSNIL
jgi:hypothetical protein